MKTISMIIVLLLSSLFSFSQKSEHFNLDKTGLAIGGYDPVSYIQNNKAIKGSKSYALNYEGARYYFISQSNFDKFKSNPHKYIPAYGGWCAFAMGDMGEKVKIDPETFKVIDGRTYLFYNFFFNNTLDSWNENESTLKRKADLNWSKIIKQ